MRGVATSFLLCSFFAGCVVVGNDAPRRRPIAVDPVCGAGVDPSTPWQGRFRGQVFYFHSDYCREAFYAEPEATVGVRGREVAFYVDPVCGRNVAATTPWRDRYQGQPYYFHSQQCFSRFHAHPEPYLGRYRRYDAR